MQFGAAGKRASWDETRGLWVVQTTSGVFEAPVLISAAGRLSYPSYPDIPGIAKFKGQVFHSCEWAGKRVGVIGTGASAIQILP